MKLIINQGLNRFFGYKNESKSTPELVKNVTEIGFIDALTEYRAGGRYILPEGPSLMDLENLGRGSEGTVLVFGNMRAMAP